MGFLRVIEPGHFTTVQDLGRPGHTHLGIPPGGAADAPSLRRANRLVGNPDAAAALEMTLTGGLFEFESDATIAVAGATASLHRQSDNAPLREHHPGQPIGVHPGDRLRIGPMTTGARAYLALRGGLDVPLILGSASTLPTARLGGHHGRALIRGDRLAIFSPSQREGAGGWANDLANTQVLQQPNTPGSPGLTTPHTLRALPGPHESLFDPATPTAFWSSSFAVSPHSNRTGLRLGGGPALQAGRPCTTHLTTEPMTIGAVQLPPDGYPIILGVDHPTTGGYPVIACIITVDVPLLGQLRPGDMVCFAATTHP